MHISSLHILLIRKILSVFSLSSEILLSFFQQYNCWKLFDKFAISPLRLIVILGMAKFR